MPQQAPPSRRRSVSSRSASELSYHARKCTICRHPQRAEIEQALLDWDCLSSIATAYRLPGRAALYRHAHALGLFARRNRGLRGALARIIEKASQVDPEPIAIVRAVELFARINDDGEWIAPPSSAVSSGAQRASCARSPAAPAKRELAQTAPSSGLSPLASNLQDKSIHARVEPDATR